MSPTLRLMPLALACSFVGIHPIISAVILPIVIYLTEAFGYQTQTSLRWALNIDYVFRLFMGFVLNPFLEAAGDLTIDPGKAAVAMTNWELIPILFYLSVMGLLLYESIPSWTKATNEADGQLFALSMVLTEEHCQHTWELIERQFYKSLRLNLILIPLIRFTSIHLAGIMGLSALSALVQFKFTAFVFCLLAFALVMILVSFYRERPFSAMLYLKQAHEVRHDLLRLANKLNTARKLNAYIRNPHHYNIEE